MMRRVTFQGSFDDSQNSNTRHLARAITRFEAADSRCEPELFSRESSFFKLGEQTFFPSLLPDQLLLSIFG